MQKKLSQKQVASYLGITGQAYSNYENGKRQADYETLLKLGDLFGASIEEMLKDDAEEPEPSAPADPLAGELFAAYGEVKDAFDADDIADIKLFMQMKAARKREKEKEDGN